MNRIKSYIDNHASGLDRKTKFISVLSGKGGVGKSVFANSLADITSRMHIRVLLVDTDFNSGNLHLLSNLRAEFGVVNYMKGELSLYEAITTIRENLDLLASPSNKEFTDLNEIAPIAKLVEKLRADASSYDLVIFDHPSGISKSSTIVAHGSDINLLVMIPELTSISDSYGLFKFLIQANPILDCRLLINRTINSDETKYIFQKFTALTSRFLERELPLFGNLPESEEIRKSVMKQTPIAELSPESIVVQLFNNMSRSLIRNNAPQRIDLEKLSNQGINENAAEADIKE